MAGVGNNFVPEFQIWSSDGLVKLFTFPAVFNTNAPQSVRDSVQLTNLRSQGAIVIDGGLAPFDLTIDFRLSGQGYVAVTSAIKNLEDTVLMLVPYLLRIQRSATAGDFFEFKVKRLLPFTYEESLRTNIQTVNATFLANSW